jgi:hypothetical protein
VDDVTAAAELTWDEPTKTSEQEIVHYKIFVQEKDAIGSPHILTTTNARTNYRLHFQKYMYGKNLVFSVQAVAKTGKISQLSEQGIFTVPLESHYQRSNTALPVTHESMTT